MSLFKYIRGFFAALFLGTPNFAGQTETDDIAGNKIEHQIDKGLEVGTIETEAQRQQQQYTIAGGPGSDNIYARFDALPKAEREAMIAARGGRIVKGDALAACDGLEGAGGIRTDRIAAALARRGVTDRIADARKGAPAATPPGFENIPELPSE